MAKTLARHWAWVSRVVLLASIPPLAILSAWLGVSVWRTEVVYHVSQTLTVANEGVAPQVLRRVAWVVPSQSASQTCRVLETSSPVDVEMDADMTLASVRELAVIPFGESVVYRLDLVISVSDAESMPSIDTPDPTYTAPAPFLEVEDPRITAQAQAIVGGETAPTVKARLIYDYVLANVGSQDLGVSPPGEYEANQRGTPGAQPGALWTLEHGYGVCGNFAALYTALCRAAGVPARIVDGLVDVLPVPYLTQEGDWGTPVGSHAWAEVYLPDRGWVPVDPFWGQGLGPLREKYFLDLDNMHIALGDGSRLRPAFYELVERERTASGWVAAMSGPYWYVVVGSPDADLTVTPHMTVRAEGLPTLWRPLVIFLAVLVAWGGVVDLVLRFWARRVLAR